MAIHKPIDLVNRSVTPTDLIWQIRERNSEARTTTTALNARTICTKFEIRSLLSSLCDANMIRSGNLGLIAYSDHDEIIVVNACAPKNRLSFARPPSMRIFGS